MNQIIKKIYDDEIVEPIIYNKLYYNNVIDVVEFLEKNYNKDVDYELYYSNTFIIIYNDNIIDEDQAIKELIESNYNYKVLTKSHNNNLNMLEVTIYNLFDYPIIFNHEVINDLIDDIIDYEDEEIIIIKDILKKVNNDLNDYKHELNLIDLIEVFDYSQHLYINNKLVEINKYKYNNIIDKLLNKINNIIPIDIMQEFYINIHPAFISSNKHNINLYDIVEFELSEYYNENLYNYIDEIIINEYDIDTCNYINNIKLTNEIYMNNINNIEIYEDQSQQYYLKLNIESIIELNNEISYNNNDIKLLYDPLQIEEIIKDYNDIKNYVDYIYDIIESIYNYYQFYDEYYYNIYYEDKNNNKYYSIYEIYLNYLLKCNNYISNYKLNINKLYNDFI